MKNRRHFNHRTPILQAVVLLIVFVSYLAPASRAQTLDTFESISEAYAHTMLNVTDQRERKRQLERLLEQANAYQKVNRGTESYYLLARITYGYTSTQGPLGVRRGMGEVRDFLEQALEMEKEALQGNPQALLGYLYVGLPGWPISFGDEDKGLELLNEAMAIDDTNMTNNYFYTGVLLRNKNYVAAKEQLLQAKALIDEDSRTPLLQQLVLREINDELAAIEKRLE